MLRFHEQIQKLTGRNNWINQRIAVHLINSATHNAFLMSNL
ncbi:Uncharacterized protein ChrSV_2838 [Chromobacterium vaccinii]|nr:Uncharacterized protein ChrSW_2838 [Chromobacterium vaccinii]QND90295.1 Uncharacterized protein ChrSV_2838 [Chromobacterium vaccinii]